MWRHFVFVVVYSNSLYKVVIVASMINTVGNRQLF